MHGLIREIQRRAGAVAISKLSQRETLAVLPRASQRGIHSSNVRDLALPEKQDPYTEIYKSRDWYGLIPNHNAVVVNIAYKGQCSAKPEETKVLFKLFNTLIDKVQLLHENLNGIFHHLTYALWSNDGAFRTWGTVSWDHKISHHDEYMGNPMPGMGGYRRKEYEDDHLGNVTYQYLGATLQRCIDPGDGTVPGKESAAICTVQKKKIFGSPGNRHNPSEAPPQDDDDTRGFDHSECCNYKKVRDTVFEFAVDMIEKKME